MSNWELAGIVIAGLLTYIFMGVVAGIIWMQFFPKEKLWAQHKFHYDHECSCYVDDHTLDFPLLFWPVMLVGGLLVALPVWGMYQLITKSLTFMADSTKELGKR